MLFKNLLKKGILYYVSECFSFLKKINKMEDTKMKKVLKKCCAFMLVAALAVSGLALTPNVSLAAKKPALNKKKVSVKVGATYKLKVKNANKKAKVAWKSGNKKVVKLTKLVKKGKKASAVINGVAEGTATVKATYKLAGTKKKTLKCKVTVTPADNAAPASAATTAPAGATTQQPAGTTAAPALQGNRRVDMAILRGRGDRRLG